MRKLINQQNINPADSNYLKGSTRDKSTGVYGTIWSNGVMGDIIEFFQKLTGNAGIIENELPDNETNGHQLIDAFLYLGEWVELSLLNGWTGSAKYRVDKYGYLELSISLDSSSATLGTFASLPSSARPDYLQRIYVFGGDGVDTHLYFVSGGDLAIVNFDLMTVDVVENYCRIIRIAPATSVLSDSNGSGPVLVIE